MTTTAVSRGLGSARFSTGSGTVAKVAAIGGVLVLWWLLSLVARPGTLPSPLAVLEAFGRLLTTTTYWTALGNTLAVWALGLALCLVVGVPVGLALGVSRRATLSTRWAIDFFRTIPTIALLPLVLLMFGPTIRMELTMIVASAIWPMIIQSMYAAKQVEPLHKWVVRVFKIRMLDRLVFLWAPSVSLLVSTGVRLAATMALLMTISAEYIGGAPGLGSQLSSMEQAFRRPEVYAYAITAGLIGLLINMILVGIQRRTLHWHPIIRGEQS